MSNPADLLSDLRDRMRASFGDLPEVTEIREEDGIVHLIGTSGYAVASMSREVWEYFEGQAPSPPGTL